MTHSACKTLVATTITPGTAPIIEQCGHLTRCPECDRRYAILRAHITANRDRCATSSILISNR